MSILAAARAEALFVHSISHVPAVEPAAVADAVRETVRLHHISGIAAIVAQEYGDHPETACPRMVAARATIASVYGGAR